MSSSAGCTGYRITTKIHQLARTIPAARQIQAGATTLSRGMRQKLAVCCAYLYSPSVILLTSPDWTDPPAIRLCWNRSISCSKVPRSLSQSLTGHDRSCLHASACHAAWTNSVFRRRRHIADAIPRGQNTRRRLLRCHPFCRSGLSPEHSEENAVPPAHHNSEAVS